jgi:c-di-GMP-binding flagellar brake protein YcgR
MQTLRSVIGEADGDSGGGGAPETEAGRQRRQNVRVDVKLPLEVSANGHAGAYARSRDLSATGVGFATRVPLEIDDTGNISVEFEDGWKLESKFQVRFVKPIIAGRQVGVQFVELNEDDTRRLTSTVFAIQREMLKRQRRGG